MTTTLSGRLPLRCEFKQFLSVLLPLVLLAASGCSSREFVTFRKIPQNPLAGPLAILSASGPQPTERTVQYLRQSDLPDVVELPPRAMLTTLQEHVAAEPTAQGMYTIAELTYLAGLKAKREQDEGAALDMFGASVAHAYIYLLDRRFAQRRNAYDPQFRRACDLYNSSLEETLRIVAQRGDLKPGYIHTINNGNKKFDVEIVAQGRWRLDEIDRFEFASDYEVNGLTNNHHTFGLGVPLIAVRKSNATDSPTEQFYPPGVTFPITAFLRVCDCEWDEEVAEATHAASNRTVHRCRLELYDPLDSTDVAFGRRVVPLESDLSVPLAYFLNQPAFAPTSLRNIAYLGFLNPNAGREIQGLYLLEPYDPNKIPVVFVHGLASSPVTWTDMYNDLRADTEVGRNYQFWFYFYPTGQPFWVSATQFRRDLADALATLDPQRQAPRLDEMVLVGHSMGGLLSKLQTIDSRDDYWRLISDGSPEELRGSDENRAALLSTVYFKPNPSIRRVVTIGTPHRGSYFANPITRAFTRTVAELPSMVVDTKKQLARDNADLLKPSQLMTIETGVDSLIPDSPFLPLMLESPPAAWVNYNNIIGVVDESDVLGRISGEEGDGVVSLTSARLPDVDSEITVPAGHTSIHRHPKAIREVTRILCQHLRQMNGEAQHRLASYGDTRPPHLRGPRHGYRLEDHYGPTAGVAPELVVPAGHMPTTPSDDSYPGQQARTRSFDRRGSSLTPSPHYRVGDHGRRETLPNDSDATWR
jgi:pimeloyl-ACP methyl ester carboxylesterase